MRSSICAAHAALHLGLLAVGRGLRLLVQRPLVALDVADLLHQIGDDPVLLREPLGAEAVRVLIHHLAQPGQIVAQLGQRAFQVGVVALLEHLVQLARLLARRS